MANMGRVVPIMGGVALGSHTWLCIIALILVMSRGHRHLELHLVIRTAGHGGEDLDLDPRGGGPDPVHLGAQSPMARLCGPVN